MNKYKTIILLTLLMMVGAKAFAHHIEVKNADGVTIYYNRTNNTELAVSYRGDSSSSYSNEYTGNVVIPETVTYKGITYSVTSIGKDAFDDCSGLTAVTIPNSVTSIGNWAFYGCSGLKAVTIPNSVTSIGVRAFQNCSGLKAVTIGNSVTSIGDYAFFGCSGLTAVTIPFSVTSIGRYAFAICSGLTAVTIRNSVKSIGTHAFYGCSGLTAVTIPDSVTSIGSYAFANCSRLTAVTCLAMSVPETEANAFDSSNIGNATLYVPEGSIAAYQAIAPWSGFGNITWSGPDDSGSCGENLYFTFVEATGKLTIIYSGEGSGAMTNYTKSSSAPWDSYRSTIKTVVVTNGVTSIGDFAFYGCSGLTSVTIPNSVTSIGGGAFYGCSGLTAVTIPNSVTSIGNSAFGGCSGLTAVTIGNSVTSIGDGAFRECIRLTAIDIPNSVTSIGRDAFYGCSGLTTVTIGNNVTSISPYVFYGCSGLTAVTIPNSVTDIGECAFWGCSQLTTINVPVNDYSAFCNNTIVSLINWHIGRPVRLINEDGNEITDYIIPEGTTKIGSSAFYCCTGLTSVTIPNSVTDIGERAFQNCSGLTEVHYNATECTSMGSFKYPVFGYCKSLKTLNISDNVKKIPANAFKSCSGLTAVTIPYSVTSIGDWAFEDCSGLTAVTIPNSVTLIGERAFSSCSGLTSITVESGNSVYDSRENCNAIIKTSSNELVIGCKNTFIPNSVTSIGNYAFYGCSGLTAVTIPNSVTSIGERAFNGCNGLTAVTCLAMSVPETEANAFDSSNIGNAMLGVLPGSELAYESTAPWSGFGIIAGAGAYIGPCGENLSCIFVKDKGTLIIFYKGEGSGAMTNYGYGSAPWYPYRTAIKTVVVANGVTSISNSAFYGCSALTTVTIGNNVTRIGNAAFWNCSGITSVTMGNSVTEIGDNAFYGCSGLTAVAIGNSVTSISGGAFQKCTGLTSVIIPNSVKSIGDMAFRECIRLTAIDIPNSVTSIGHNAFAHCGLTAVTIGNSVTEIREGTFYNCDLTAVTIPNNVTSIGSYAFAECRFLTAVTIPNSVTSISDMAFRECIRLTAVTIPYSVTSIGSYAFSNCSRLTAVTCLAMSVPETEANAFDSSNIGNATLYVPEGSIAAYQATTPWSEFGNIAGAVADDGGSCGENLYFTFVEATGTLTIFCAGEGSGAMTNYTDSSSVPWDSYRSTIKTVVVANGVTSIGAYAFCDCSGLTYVTTPNSVTSIGERAFSGCKGLTSMTIPDSVTSIGNYAFYGCSGLTAVTIPDSVTSIGSYAFANCSGLTAVTCLAMSVPETEANAFDSSNIGNTTLYVPAGSIAAYQAIAPWSGFGNITWSDPDDSGSCGENLSFTFVEATGTLTIFCSGEGSGAMTNYTESSSAPWDSYRSTIKTVVVTNGVTSIGTYAFYGCNGLTAIDIPNSVTSIGRDAFEDCSGLTAVTIPNNVTEIGNYTFRGCKGLNSVIIPNNVTSIGEHAFEDCSGLTAVTIPNSVTEIGVGAFEDCSGLTEVNFNATNCTKMGESDLPVFKNCTSIIILNIGDNVQTIPDRAFEGCSGLTAVTIPNSVTLIGERAFYGCSGLTAVTIPNSVTKIGDDAFRNCSGLTAVTIPNSVTSIGERAFNGCSGLTAVTIPNSVTEIGIGAFRNCSGLTEVNFNATNCTSMVSPFSYCTSLKTLNIGDNVQIIPALAFYGCSGLTTVTIPNSVTSIGVQAFSGCSGLTSITVESGNSVYDSRENCNAIIKTSSNELVTGCNNTIIPNSVTSIGNYAFYGCSGLTAVTIPNSVTSIGERAFNGCSGLTAVTCLAMSVPETEANAFDSSNIGNATLYVPAKSKVAYQETAPWSEFGIITLTDADDGGSCGENLYFTFVEATGTLTIIYSGEGSGAMTDYLFGAPWSSYRSTIKTVVVTNGVTSIGFDAFSDCSGLTSVIIPNSVTSIGIMAFRGCNSLTSFVVEWDAPITIPTIFYNSNYENANLYVPKGSKESYQGADYWKSFKAIKEYPDSDVNQDEETDVVDVVDIARYVVGTPAESFDVFLADINSDKTVNVADAVVLVNDIAGDTNWLRSMRAPQSSHSDVLTLTENDDHSLSLQLEGNGHYTAFQFDLTLPAEMDIMQMMLNGQRKQGHQLLYNKVDESHYRVVALSTSNREFKGSSGELLNIVTDGFATDGFVVNNIHFITPEGVDVPFEAITLSIGSEATGISRTSEGTDLQQNVYNLNGQRIAVPQKGLNIINGKKVVIK